MEQYNVTGMSCAACSARVEKAVNGVPGVTSCSVSLLTNSMGVEGTASAEAIIKAVEEAGYGASLKGTQGNGTSGEHGSFTGNSTPAFSEDALADKETPVLKRRLVTSLGFLLVLMYVSMGHMMWGWPVPEFLERNPIAVGLLQLLLTVIVMVINQKFFINAYKRALQGKKPHKGKYCKACNNLEQPIKFGDIVYEAVATDIFLMINNSINDSNF